MRQDSGVRGSRRRSECLGVGGLMEESPHVSAGEKESQARRCWCTSRSQEGGKLRRFPGRGFYDWVFK